MKETTCFMKHKKKKNRSPGTCALCSETCFYKTASQYIWLGFTHKGFHGCILKDKTRLAVEKNFANEYLPYSYQKGGTTASAYHKYDCIFFANEKVLIENNIPCPFQAERSI